MKDLWVFILAVSALFIILSTFIVSFTMLFIKRRRQHKDEKQALEGQFRETLLKSQLEIREQTLENVSQELHDNLGQMASLIKINLNLMAMEHDSATPSRLDETKDLTQQLITDLKGISASLNGGLIAKIGLDKSIENEVKRLKRLGTIDIDYRHPEVMQQPGEQKSIILLRMFQEMMNNILKHSGAKKVVIDLQDQPKVLLLNVTDDGHGFDPETAANKGGSGLYNLQKRAGLIGARLDIKSSPGQGTTISIEVPRSI